MKKKTTVDIIRQSRKTTLYSISFEMDGTTEFEKFVAEFEMSATFNKDYQRIIAALQSILRVGALERFFRPEGKVTSGLSAIPVEDSRLRLYCLRISEQIIILGGGGVKTAKKYEHDPKLFGYVLDLQRFEKILNNSINKGYVHIEEKELLGIEDTTFEI